MKNRLFKTGLAALCVLGMYASTAGAEIIAPFHQSRNIPCEACHTKYPKADYNKCIMCHGGTRENLIKLRPQHQVLKNPDVPCRVCHKGHRE